MRHKGFPGGRGKVPTNAAEARDGVQSPGQEGHPEQGMAPYCSIPAGTIPWTEERQAPVLGSQGVRHNRATSHACTRPSTALLAVTGHQPSSKDGAGKARGKSQPLLSVWMDRDEDVLHRFHHQDLP